MTKAFSVYLDAVRFLAALVVVLYHLSYERYTGGDLQFLYSWHVGGDAVVIFFVLSGLVIAYAAERDGTAVRFACNRLTRLYSVLVPALVITFVLDRAGQALDPAAYDGWWYAPTPLWEMALRGLTFSNQWFADPVRLGSNGPLWSLSYEAGYYLIFGVAMFAARTTRLLLIAALALVVGPGVLLLMPAWWVGVSVWRRIRDRRFLSRPAAWSSALFFPVFYVAGHVTGLPEGLSQLSLALAGLASLEDSLGFSHRFLWHNTLAFAFALHLAGMASLLSPHSRWNSEAVIRWLAGASFSIYVLHYPLLQLLNVVLPESLDGRTVILFGLTLAACFGIAELTERRLGVLRGFLQNRDPNFARQF